MANATDSRNADNRAFKAAVKADTDSVMLVTKAIEALSKFYSLRQDHVKITKDAKQPEYTTSEDTPPETFEGTYGGRGSENTGIVGILDMIKEDLQKDIAKAHEEEAEGMAAYRALIEESKETIAALNKKINAMKTQIADTEYQKEEDSTEWKEKDQQGDHRCTEEEDQRDEDANRGHRIPEGGGQHRVEGEGSAEEGDGRVHRGDQAEL